MKRLLAVLFLGLLAATTAMPQGSDRLYTNPDLPSRPVLNRLDMKLAWSARLPVEGRRDGIASLQLLPGDGREQILVQTLRGLVLLLDAETGDTLWRNYVGQPYDLAPPAGSSDQNIFCVRKEQFYILNRANGQQRLYTVNKKGHVDFGMPLQTAPSAAPVSDGFAVFFVRDIKLTAYFVPVYAVTEKAQAAAAAEKQVPDSTPLRSSAQPEYLWNAVTYGLSVLTPAVLGQEELAVVSSDGTFMCFSFKGNERFRYKFQGTVSAPMGQFDDERHGMIAYVGCEDFTLYALSLITGRLHWRFQTGGPIRLQPWVTKDDVFVSANRVGLYRVDRKSGEGVWQNREAVHFLATNQKFVYATDRFGKLLVLDYLRGTRMAEYDASGFTVALGNELTDRLFLAAHDGTLICMHRRDNFSPFRVRPLVKKSVPKEEMKKEEMKKEEMKKEEMKKEEMKKDAEKAGRLWERMPAQDVPALTLGPTPGEADKARDRQHRSRWREQAVLGRRASRWSSRVTRWRVGVAFLLLLAGIPLAAPLRELSIGMANNVTDNGTPPANPWVVWEEISRLLSLARNTVLLVGGTLALALPLGTFLAVLLYRTDVPFRGAFHFVILLSLFVPLPLLTSAWQATLGTGGLLPVAFWGERVGQPWSEGLLPAVWIHALAALPWVVLIVGQGLCWVEGELEEEALLATSPWCVLWSVTLPRSRMAVAAAALWVGLQTANEITVTDMMQARTFAEEVYTQFGFGGGEALARAVAVSLPASALTWCVLALLLPILQRHLPPLGSLLVGPRLFPTGRARWACLLALVVGVFLLLGVPLLSLGWKAGLHGRPLAWSAPHVAQQFLTTLRLNGATVFWSLFFAGLTGLLAAGAALVLCWAAQGSLTLQVLAVIVLGLAWSLPGPVTGLGLKEVILGLVSLAPQGWLADWLYRGPSPVPMIWAHLLRFVPYAVAVLWPVLRAFPQELRDAARVDGAAPGRELVRVVVPLTARAWLAAVLVVSALSLGEISAAKMVETPGWKTFALVVFDRMHYGVSSDVASLCLLLLAFVTAAALGALLGRRAFPGAGSSDLRP